MPGDSGRQRPWSPKRGGQGQRRRRSRQRGRERSQQEERARRKKEKEEPRAGSEPRTLKRKDQPERRSEEEAGGCSGRHRTFSGSKVPQEVRQQSTEESQEEEKILLKQQLEQQRQLLQRGVGRGLCGGAQDPPDRKEGAGPFSGASSQGDAGLLVDERRRDLASRGVRTASPLDPVLPTGHGAQIARSTFERSFDLMLCNRPDPSREDSRIGRHAGSEAEKYRTSVAGGCVANRAATGGIASGTTSSFNEEQKEESKTKSEASQSRGKGEGWKSSSWTESGGDGNRKGKEAKGKGKKGKHKEEAKK